MQERYNLRSQLQYFNSKYTQNTNDKICTIMQ